MDPEIKKALANIKRRQAEINKLQSEETDSGPVFDKTERRRRVQAHEILDEEELDYDDDELWDNHMDFLN